MEENTRPVGPSFKDGGNSNDISTFARTVWCASLDEETTIGLLPNPLTEEIN